MANRLDQQAVCWLTGWFGLQDNVIGLTSSMEVQTLYSTRCVNLIIFRLIFPSNNKFYRHDILYIRRRGFVTSPDITFICLRMCFNIIFLTTTLNKTVLKVCQCKRNVRKFKKFLLSSETNIINTELVISLKNKSKHEII